MHGMVEVLGEIGKLLLKQLKVCAVGGELMEAFHQDENGSDRDGQEDREDYDDRRLIEHSVIIEDKRFRERMKSDRRLAQPAPDSGSY